MNLDNCKNLKALTSEEILACNGGSLINTIIKKLLPPIIMPIPIPDPDFRL